MAYQPPQRRSMDHACYHLETIWQETTTRETSQAVGRRPGQILERDDLAEDCTRQANLETASWGLRPTTGPKAAQWWTNDVRHVERRNFSETRVIAFPNLSRVLINLGKCIAESWFIPLFPFTFLGPPDFGQSCHLCSWLTYCRWLFVTVVWWVHIACCLYSVELAVVWIWCCRTVEQEIPNSLITVGAVDTLCRVIFLDAM